MSVSTLVQAATNFLEMPSARPAALGEAFSAATNDVSALTFNPSSLQTLSSSQVSFMYEKGLTEDAYGQFLFGAPMKNASLGLSVGYYDGGTIEIFDGVNERSVSAKKDMTASVGIASRAGRFVFGLSGKYISSQLIETYKATAFAADFGLQTWISSRMRLGAAVQNIGSKLKYVSESEHLPRVARAGVSYALFPGAYRTTLSLEAPYYMNDSELRPSAGLETIAGPLALRVGYRTGSNFSTLTLGAGFMINGMSVDYSYGLVQDLDANHKISIGMKFAK